MRCPRNREGPGPRGAGQTAVCQLAAAAAAASRFPGGAAMIGRRRAPWVGPGCCRSSATSSPRPAVRGGRGAGRSRGRGPPGHTPPALVTDIRRHRFTYPADILRGPDPLRRHAGTPVPAIRPLSAARGSAGLGEPFMRCVRIQCGGVSHDRRLARTPWRFWLTRSSAAVAAPGTRTSRSRRARRCRRSCRSRERARAGTRRANGRTP